MLKKVSAASSPYIASFNYGLRSSSSRYGQMEGRCRSDQLNGPSSVFWWVPPEARNEGASLIFNDHASIAGTKENRADKLPIISVSIPEVVIGEKNRTYFEKLSFGGPVTVI